MHVPILLRSTLILIVTTQKDLMTVIVNSYKVGTCNFINYTKETVNIPQIEF